MNGHYLLNGHELEQTPGDNGSQGKVVCCSPWGCKESDRTEQLNNSKNTCIYSLHLDALK